jgi:hypothetical protein
MESPATTSHLLPSALRSSAALSRCAPQRSASLDHCQLSVCLGPHVATLLVLESQLLPTAQGHSARQALCRKWVTHGSFQASARFPESPPHLTVGMPTQPPELNSMSQNLSYWKRKPGLALWSACTHAQLLAETLHGNDGVRSLKTAANIASMDGGAGSRTSVGNRGPCLLARARCFASRWAASKG